MKRIAINRSNYGIQREHIQFESILTDNIYLYLIVNGFYQIKAGDYIAFDRFVSAEGSDSNVSVASKKKVVLFTDYDKEKNKTIIAVRAEEKNLLRIKQITDSGSCFITEFEYATNIFAQDVVFANGATIQSYNPQTNEFTDIAEIYFNETDRINGKKNYEYIVNPCCPASDFIYNTYNQTDYNDCNEHSQNPSKEPMYYYLPYKTNSNVLSFPASATTDLSSYIGQNLFYKYNTFYYQDDAPTTSEYDILSGLTLYECHLWKDIIRGDLREDDIDRYNVINIDKIIDFWGVSVGLSSDNDYTHLYQEENILGLYVNNIKKKVIDGTPVIDMEKMKYAPYYEEGNFLPITSITYNLHFRQRNLEDNEWSYVDDEEAFWNPFILGESGETDGLYPEDLRDSGSVFSDMLYYLGFTDNDVQNQKQKIRKSFLRLSFYDSTDPLTQKLIYYSSIFMDSGELFGKYIKAKNELVKNGESGNNVVLSSQKSEKYRLDCRFVVKNEFYTTKSSDGFNIYYFPDDVPEISGKTIYMKVEFNHAGYGRTIPMIVWPENDLTMEEIKNGALYIPLTLKNISEDENVNGVKGYAYIFEENDFIKRENNTLTLNLVEPKLIENGNN